MDIDEGFKEVAFNYRPLFNEIDPENEGREYEKYQYYLKRANIEPRDTLQRLMRTYQQYKTSYFIFNKRSNAELYQDLITVDPYKFNFNITSFTFLHWSLIEQIQNKKIEAHELEEDVVRQILYNILPGGNTVLHKLADNENELISLFKISHPDHSEKPTIHIPFLPNIRGETPIHKCIHKKDYKSIDTILKYLKYYPVDHHSRGIHDLYGDMIEKGLPEFLNYLDSRFQQTG